MFDRRLRLSGQRGVAVVVAIPALAFLVGKLPAASEVLGLLARSALFGAASVTLLLMLGARLRDSLQWWSAAPVLLSCVIAGASSDASVRTIALIAFVAVSEEVVFRGLAVDAVLGTSITRASVLAASVTSSLAFATSHFAAGGVPWSAPAWWAYVGSGACLMLIRVAAGIETTAVLHFGINLLFATGILGAQVLPHYPVLLFVAVAAPLVTAVLVPRYLVVRVSPTAPSGLPLS